MRKRGLVISQSCIVTDMKMIMNSTYGDVLMRNYNGEKTLIGSVGEDG